MDTKKQNTTTRQKQGFKSIGQRERLSADLAPDKPKRFHIRRKAWKAKEELRGYVAGDC
jgi:hypothetical protein